MRKAIVLSTVLVAVLPIVAGCGGTSKNQSNAKTSKSPPPAAASTPSSAAGASNTIGETEYKLTPANPTVSKSGTVTLTAKNDGAIVHALTIEHGGPGGKDARSTDIQPGASVTLTANLKPGKYEIYCPIDGHKAQGMKGELTVSGGGATPAAKPAKSTKSTSKGTLALAAGTPLRAVTETPSGARGASPIVRERCVAVAARRRRRRSAGRRSAALFGSPSLEAGGTLVAVQVEPHGEKLDAHSAHDGGALGRCGAGAHGIAGGHQACEPCRWHDHAHKGISSMFRA